MKDVNTNSMTTVQINGSSDSISDMPNIVASRQKQILEDMMPRLKRISPDALIARSIPPRHLTQEAANLSICCHRDKAALLKAGLNWKQVEELDAMIAALAEAESNWCVIRSNPESKRGPWRTKLKQVAKQRQIIIRYMRHGFRNHPALLATVAQIADNRDDADFIQDFNDLSVLGRDNMALLTQIGMPEDLITEAARNNTELRQYKAEAAASPSAYKQTQLLRDQAYTLLKQTVDEIRVFGRFAFDDNPMCQKDYRSAYYINVNRNKKVRRARGKEQAASNVVDIKSARPKQPVQTSPDSPQNDGDAE